MMELFAFLRQSYGQSVELFFHENLAPQSAVILNEKGLVEHILLIFRRFVQLMVAFNVAMTGSAHGHAATGPFDRQLISLTDLHEVHVHIGWGSNIVLHTFAVNDVYGDIGHVYSRLPTPPMTVVYLNESFLSGKARLKALCTMMVASWNPQRMSLSLPG